MWDFLQAMAPAAALPCLNCSPMHHPITRNQPNRTRQTADKLPLISSPADPRAVSSPPADNGMGCPAVHLLMVCLSQTCSTASRASCACCICCAAAACASGPAVTDATSSSACSCSTRVSRAVTCSNMISLKNHHAAGWLETPRDTAGCIQSYVRTYSRPPMCNLQCLTLLWTYPEFKVGQTLFCSRISCSLVTEMQTVLAVCCHTACTPHQALPLPARPGAWLLVLPLLHQTCWPHPQRQPSGCGAQSPAATDGTQH